MVSYYVRNSNINIVSVGAATYDELAGDTRLGLHLVKCNVLEVSPEPDMSTEKFFPTQTCTVWQRGKSLRDLNTAGHDLRSAAIDTAADL